jgi:hypothetical protein
MPQLEIYHTQGDIRKAISLPVEKVDLVICMEVIEHLGDIDSDDIETLAIYQGSGIKGFLENIKPFLTDVSHVFITTPNVTCYKSIFNTLYGAHPFCYTPHTREHTPKDVMNMLQDCGYKHTIYTETVWYQHELPSHIITDIQAMIKKYGLDDSLRGDDIFAIAQLA